jgi:septal ring factor EnvC (AmiA/AmiB activator)
MLESIRRDEGRRREALRELRQAAEELGRLAEALELAEETGALDIDSFKGLLDWPVEGELRSGFGEAIHPEFKTKVPHPGWDLAAPFGANVAAVFDGRVVFADWMRGYGLTAIIDHGSGVLTIYAHASMLLVQAGDLVVRGQTLGKVGETGSLRGPFLYFEMRVDGEPTDPAAWLRRR